MITLDGICPWARPSVIETCCQDLHPSAFTPHTPKLDKVYLADKPQFEHLLVHSVPQMFPHLLFPPLSKANLDLLHINTNSYFANRQKPNQSLDNYKVATLDKEYLGHLIPDLLNNMCHSTNKVKIHGLNGHDRLCTNSPLMDFHYFNNFKDLWIFMVVYQKDKSLFYGQTWMGSKVKRKYALHALQPTRVLRPSNVAKSLILNQAADFNRFDNWLHKIKHGNAKSGKVATANPNLQVVCVALARR